MEDKKIFIIIPTYNESENIETLLRAIFSLGIEGLKVIVVDDNSPDGTGKIADRLAGIFPIIVLHRANKQGIGSAYIKGFKLALNCRAGLVMEMDADLSHDPKDIPRLIQASLNGADVVLGSRRVEGGAIIGWDKWRHFYSKGAMAFSRKVLGLKSLDVTSGFRCYKRSILEKIDLDKIKSNGYAFQEEMLYLCEKNGADIEEIPIVFKDRQKGRSKLSGKEIREFFLVMMKLRFAKKNKK